MATAKREGGLYYKPIGTTGKYVAVDAEGETIKDAPKRPADTDPSRQPAAGGMLSPEERVAVAVAKAMKDPDAILARSGATAAGSGASDTGGTSATDSTDEPDETDSDEEEGLPTLAEMPAYLASIDDVDELRSMRRQDKRKGAKDLYAARLDQLGG